MLADQLRKAIETSGWTSYEIAKRAGTSPQTLYRFVSGDRDLTLGTADPILKVLGLTLAKRGESPEMAPPTDYEERLLETAAEMAMQLFQELCETKMDTIVARLRDKRCV
jgi:transcriptional regulator with XRE-family HTH domain